MSIHVTELVGDDVEQWDEYASRSPYSTPFHQRRMIDLVARYTDSTPHLLVGRKGQEVIGLLPLFKQTRGPLSSVRSPPGHTHIAYVGPLRSNFENRKQRKREKENRRFLEGCLDWIDETIDPDLVDIRCCDRYADVRPFLWNGFDVTPSYTYVVDLSVDAEALFESFSRDARSNVRTCDEAGCRVQNGGRDLVRQLNDRIHSHYRQRGIDRPITTDFLAELYESLGEDVIRPYGCYVDGELVGGTITVWGSDTVFRWIGGVAPLTDMPVNEFVDWRIMQDAIEAGVDRYDLHGAMEQGVWEYKSKFSPTPRPLFKIRQQTARRRVIAGAYRHLPSTIRSIVG